MALSGGIGGLLEWGWLAGWGGRLRWWRMVTWQFAREVFEEQFRPLQEAGFSLERLEGVQAYRGLYERELLAHFPREVFFALSELRSDHERSGQERLAGAAGGEPLTDYSVLRRGGALVGMFSGEQKTASIPLSSQPPTGQNVPITVNVKPVPGEEVTDNNKADFTVIFTR